MGLVGYIRVSRINGREGEGYISPSVQREAIERYAGEIGEPVTQWADDQDFSGGTADRPAFQAALADLEEGRASGVVVMRIDRFARSVADGARIVREIVDRGQVFASCHERIDPRTPEGRFMLTSFLANAELFLDQKKADWKVSKARAVARGVHIGPAPIGYRAAKSMPLEVDPEREPVIAELFERAASRRFTDSELARWVQERMPATTRGGAERRPWQASEVRRWLANRVYLGEVRYGDLVNTEAHPPLTDPQTWARAQREPGEQRKTASPFLLRGIIRCAGCRYGMGGSTVGGHNGTKRVYRCTNMACSSRSVILAERIEDHVTGLLGPHMRRLRLLGTVSDNEYRELDKAAQNASEEVAAFAADLEARRLLGEEEWRRALAVRVSDRDAKAAARDEAKRQRALADETRDVENLPDHALRGLLGDAIQAVFVRRGRGLSPAERSLVLWVDDPVVQIPGPHVSGPFEPIVWGD